MRARGDLEDERRGSVTDAFEPIVQPVSSSAPVAKFLNRRLDGD
jgi:hypothetical protein